MLRTIHPKYWIPAICSSTHLSLDRVEYCIFLSSRFFICISKSHVDHDVDKSIIDKLNSDFSKLSELSVAMEKVHDYLEMNIGYITKGKNVLPHV